MAVDRSRFVAAVFLQEVYNSCMTHHVTMTTVAYEKTVGLASPQETIDERWLYLQAVPQFLLDEIAS